MSGGGGKVDPYYQSDPPRKEARAGPRKPLDLRRYTGHAVVGPTKVFRVPPDFVKYVFGGHTSKRVYWFQCDNCGEVFPSERRKYTQTVSCSRECRNALWARLSIGRRHRPESIERMRKVQRETWQDEQKARNRREAAKTRKPRLGPSYNKGWRKYRTYVCSHCGRLFAVQRKKELESKYCSRECMTNSQRKGEWRKCDNPSCDNVIYLGPARLKASDRHYCSKDCTYSDPNLKKAQSEGKKGERNPNWKGGADSGPNSGTTPSEIRERDNRTCRSCGKPYEGGVEFPVHHMVPKKLGGPDEPWNLITVCPPCHHAADAQGGEIRVPIRPDGSPVVDPEQIRKLWDDYRRRQESSGDASESKGEQTELDLG